MVLWTNGVQGCELTDEYYCTPSELYLNRRILVSGHMPYNTDGHQFPLTGHSSKTNPVNGRAACFISNDGVNDFIRSVYGSILFPDEGYVSVDFTIEYQDLSYAEPTYFNSQGMPSGDGIGPNVGSLSTNVPVFYEEADAIQYIIDGTLLDAEHVINFKDEEIDPDDTYVYHCYSGFAQGTQTNGKMSTTASLSHNYIRVQSNKRPVLYLTGSTYSATAIYKEVVSWKGNFTGANIEDVEVDEFTSGNVVGHANFYVNMAAYIQAKGRVPADGTYTYSFEFDTDFAIYGSQEDAEYAINSGDYSQAANWPQIQNGQTQITINTGDEEASTTFGGGAFTSPFAATYVMDATALGEVANAFYTGDPTLLDNIEKGLKLFGASPFEAIAGLSAFPFDVTTMVTTSGQKYIYFGSYQHTLSNTVYKVVNRTSNYVDGGTVLISPIFNSFRDFEPWTSLHVYLPFCGWQKLDIASYIGKYVNIRYYVDIMTRTGVVVLVADGVMQDYFVCGEVGVELPICGQNLSRYANDTLNALLQSGGGVVGGAISGAMLGSAIPGVGTAVGAVGGALLGGSFGLAKGTFDMSQKGKPKDHNITKGNFSGGSGCYMPWYVTFRYDVHDIIEPKNLNQLYGRPSSYGGKLSNLSGFTKVDTIKMNTSGMSDNNITEVVNLVKEGIFL